MTSHIRGKEREAIIHSLAKRGMNLDTARGLLRCGATLHRLAEACCNGDWPADGPWSLGRAEERPAKFGRCVVLCPGCERYWADVAVKDGGCPDCRAEKCAQTLCPEGWRIEVQGDPRGRVLYIVAPDGAEITLG